MKTQVLKLTHSPYYGEKMPDLIVEVTYRKADHWNASQKNVNGTENLYYEIVVDGEVRGTVQHVTESTDRNYNRIRVPGKGRLAWSWRRSDGTYNHPGLYERTRLAAVANVLGYLHAEVVR